MKNLGYILAAVGGAAVGFAAGYFFKQKKDEQYIHEQIMEARASVETAADRILKQFNEQGDRIKATDKDISESMETPRPHFDGQFTDKEDMHAYLNRIHGSGYDDPERYHGSGDNGNDPEYRNGLGETKEQEMERRMNAQPYRMENQNFGQFPDHELVGFTLYSDGILTDDNNEQIFDSRELTGVSIGDLMDMMRIIPEEEEKVLFFRNERAQLDIEIISSDETYQDSIGVDE